MLDVMMICDLDWWDDLWLWYDCGMGNVTCADGWTCVMLCCETMNAVGDCCAAS